MNTWLRETMGFSASEGRAFDAGSAVIKSLDTPIHEELAHVGAVYVDVPPTHFIDRFRDIEQFERGPRIHQIGRLGSPPQLADLATLTLPAPDLAAVRTCRPDDCEVKLSKEAMHRFRTEVDWSAPSAAHQANAVARDVILQLVRTYQVYGNAALGQYDDGGKPLVVAEHLRALLARRDPLPTPVPLLLDYLDDYPAGRPSGAEDFFYWVVADFGLKQTIRVNHVTIYPLAASPPADVAYVVAIKQLYASHYFHTTLELRFLIDDRRNGGRHGTALVSITRSRNDGMTGFKGLFLRPVIRGRSRDAVRGYLEHMKRQLEHPAPAGTEPPAAERHLPSSGTLYG